MARSKTKAPPSPYPVLPFHSIRACCVISSAVVTAILLYFCHHLKNEHYKIPWTFLFLLGASIFTLVTLIFTSLLHVCHNLSPKLNLIVNIPLLILWCVGFALLAWNMSETLGHVCNSDNWGNSTGVMVCRLYKALFSFSLFGMIGAITAVVLDVMVRKTQTRQGSYNKMQDPLSTFHQHSSDLKFAGMNNVTEIAMEPYRGQETGITPARNRTPRQNMSGDFGGYSAPTEQTSYDAGAWAGHDRR